MARYSEQGREPELIEFVPVSREEMDKFREQYADRLKNYEKEIVYE